MRARETCTQGTGTSRGTTKPARSSETKKGHRQGLIQEARCVNVTLGLNEILEQKRMSGKNSGNLKCQASSAWSVMSSSLQPIWIEPSRLPCPWNFQAKVLKWVPFPPLGSSWLRVSNPRLLCLTLLAGRFFTTGSPA